MNNYNPVLYPYPIPPLEPLDTRLATLSPQEFFVLHTVLGTGPEALLKKYKIERHFQRVSCRAFIHFLPGEGWIFHSLRLHDFTVLKKEDCYLDVRGYEYITPYPTEAAIVAQIAYELTLLGHCVQTEVRCATGVADILTEQAVYEVKSTSLSPSAFTRAAHQVLRYRDAINADLWPIVVGKSPRRSTNIRSQAEAFGVSVLFWEHR